MTQPSDRRPALVPPQQRESLLIRGWMTHDAMWFFHCLQECGIDNTNKINKAAVRAMAQVEMKRVAKAVGAAKVETFEQLQDLMAAVFDLMKGDFMDFTWSVTDQNTIHWDIPRCFAYEGVQKLGVSDQYQCGIFDRMEGWTEALGVETSVTPKVHGCMMHTHGRCFRDFKFKFD